MLTTYYHQHPQNRLLHEENQRLQARAQALTTQNRELQEKVNSLIKENISIRDELDNLLSDLERKITQTNHLKSQFLNLSLNFEDKQDSINRSIQSAFARLKDQAQQSLERISSQIPDDLLASLEKKVSLLEESLPSQADTQPSQNSLTRLLEEIKIAQKQYQSLLNQAQSLEPQPIKRR